MEVGEVDRWVVTSSAWQRERQVRPMSPSLMSLYFTSSQKKSINSVTEEENKSLQAKKNIVFVLVISKSTDEVGKMEVQLQFNIDLHGVGQT